MKSNQPKAVNYENTNLNTWNIWGIFNDQGLYQNPKPVQIPVQVQTKPQPIMQIPQAKPKPIMQMPQTKPQYGVPVYQQKPQQNYYYNQPQQNNYGTYY